nr:hypothetical protein [Tanacetum cinerariifolium]
MSTDNMIEDSSKKSTGPLEKGKIREWELDVREGKEPNEDENRLDSCDSTKDSNNVKCVNTLEKERKNKKRKVDDEGEFVAVTYGFKEGLSRTRSEGGESNGVQASDMDVHTTSKTKEVAKECSKHMESGSIHEDSVLGWEILLELMSLRLLEQRLELCGKAGLVTEDWIEDIWGSKNFGFAQVPAN